MFDWAGDETLRGEVRCRVFRPKSEGGLACAALFDPVQAPADARMPIVLVQHGGSSSKTGPDVWALATELVGRHGLRVIALDGPVHGARARPGGAADGASIRSAFFELWTSDPGHVPLHVRRWQALIDDIHEATDRADCLWLGLSMGTAYGLPLLAAEKRISRAVLGMWGTSFVNSERLLADASAVSCPVLFQQKWDDELFSREGQLALFDALGASDKRLHIYPGAHVLPLAEQLADLSRFLTQGPPVPGPRESAVPLSGHAALSHPMPDARLIDQLREIVGDSGVLMREQLEGRMTHAIPAQPVGTRTLVRPRSTQEVSAVLALCHRQGVAVVTQGGLTGLVHGADAQPHEVALSMERMQAIEVLDPVQRVLQAQAGVVLQTAQDAAREAGLQLCVDLGARGTATLGGMAATNAGGNKVISQGMMRDQILGLEVVLADGTVLSSMNALLKNNSGYDLKHLFIGSEGTLGVVTRLVLRLHEAQHGHAVALLGVSDYTEVCHLLRHFDSQLAGGLSAFEVMWPDFYQCVTAGAQRVPLDPQAHAFYILVEASGSRQEVVVKLLEDALEEAVDCGWCQDVVLAQSKRDCDDLWALRDSVGKLGQFGPPVAYDISLKLHDTGPYIEATRQAIIQRWASARVWAFGHLGDGNVHLVVSIPHIDQAVRRQLDALVYGPLQALGGAISAEHGIGLEKLEWLHVSRTATEIAAMRLVKATLDPKNVLNPGRVMAQAPAPCA